MVRTKVKRLKELLVNSFGEDFEIIEENYKMLTPTGEHYGSIMLAAEVAIKRHNQDKTEVLNLVAKLIPANEALRIVFNVSLTFKKEVNAYLKAIPALIQLQREYNVPESKILDIFPQCYGARFNLKGNDTEVDEDAVILFENLNFSGYLMEDRMIGYDLQTTQLIIRDLANFHSTSVALNKLKPEVFKEKVGPSIIRGSSTNSIPDSITKCIFRHAELVEQLRPHLPRLRNMVAKAIERLQEPDQNKNYVFATTVHSDFWLNNTMVLRDAEGNHIKNKIVDLQLLSFGSALGDLIFFLFTSVRNPVLAKHFDELIQLYYDEFLENLRYFGLDVSKFTWEAFLREMEEVAPRHAEQAIFMLKPIFTERGKITHTLEDFEMSDWDREDLLGEAYRNKLKDTVLALVEKNWL